MDPDTGKFFEVNDLPNPKKNTVTTREAKEKGWPIFEIGEEILIKGYPFELLHVKPSTGRVVLRPIVKESK